MANTYNGWTNRETWCVNLWFGDSFDSIIRDDIENGGYADDIKTISENDFFDEADKKQYCGSVIDDLAERYEDFVMEQIQPDLDGLPGFITDLLDLECINWFELARDVFEENFK